MRLVLNRVLPDDAPGLCNVFGRLGWRLVFFAWKDGRWDLVFRPTKPWG